MAHELENFNGRTAFVTARRHAWHQLGTVLPEEFNAAQAMQHAMLGGWDVRKEPLQAVALNADGVHTIPVPGKFATVRTNPATGKPEALGVVGDAYRPIQNEAHADLLDTLVDASGAHFETAGSLKGGRQVFITMKLPNTMTIGGVDQVDTYLAALNSHDGSTAFRLLVTPVRVVCANTQAAAIRRARACFSIQHSAGAKGRIQAARDALGLTFRHLDAFEAEAEAEKMLAESMTEAEFVAITGQLWPIEDTATPRVIANARQRQNRLAQAFSNDMTNANIRNTRWAGYQAITEYLDHLAPVDGKRNAAAVRAERVISGNLTNLKTAAFDLLSV